MPQPYPKDRFDAHPPALDRVGAHRAPGKKGRGWLAFWWALAATVVLIAIGALGLLFLNNRLAPDTSGLAPTAAPPATSTPTATPKPEPSATPTPKPTVDPNLSVTVLNGTLTMGLAGSVGDVLGSEGWTVGTLGDAATSDVAETIVYYADPALEGAARGVAESLPGAEIMLANDFAESGAELTVVVGNDYSPPAG